MEDKELRIVRWMVENYGVQFWNGDFDYMLLDNGSFLIINNRREEGGNE